MNEELQIMLDRAAQIVDPIADDSWAGDCELLMPTYRERVQREQEALRRAERERIDEANRAAAEERRLAIEKQQNTARLEWERQQRLRRQETDRARAKRANENWLLSPTSSRAVAKRKSRSSISGSGSSGDVEKMTALKGSQGKGKGKAKESDEDLRDPRELPFGAIQVSNSPQIFPFCFVKGSCLSGVDSLPRLCEIQVSMFPPIRRDPPRSVREMQNPQGQV